MTTAAATITINKKVSLGDAYAVFATVDFGPYATGGLAIAPSEFGLVEFIYAPTQMLPASGFFDYDGATLMAYSATNTEVADNTNLGALKIMVIGK
jgi:hypothetical protein